MSILSLAQLLRQPEHPKKPEPAEVFPPFLRPGEKILWAGQPSDECSRRQHLRAANLVFGGTAVACALPATVDYCMGQINNMNLFAFWVAPFILLCLVVVRAFKFGIPDAFFSVTNFRLLSYHPQSDEPYLTHLPLDQVTRLSVKNLQNGCGSIHFNPWLLKVQNHSPFNDIENVEAVAALILEAKHKLVSMAEREIV